MDAVTIFGHRVSEDAIILAVIFIVMTGILLMEMRKSRYYRTAAFSAVNAYKDLLMNAEIAGLDLPASIADKPTRTVAQVEHMLRMMDEVL